MRGAIVLVAVTLMSCAPQTAGPTPTPLQAASARPSPAVLPSSGLGALSKLPDGTLVVSVPDCATTSQGGAIAGCEVIETAADKGAFVAGLRQADGTFEARSIDLATGEIRVLIPRADVGMHIDDLDDGIAILEEHDAQGGGSAHARLIRVPSRDPSGAAVLDDIDLVGLKGGDSWNPWPMAKTNGRETVWLHAGGLFLPHDVILQTADGQKRSVYQTDQAVWFDIDDNGRVAIATLAAPLAGAATPTTEELFIYEDRALRRLGTRAVGDSGIPISFADAIGWTLGTGSVQRIDGVEIVPLAGGATRTIRPESGCVYTGRTAAEIVTICPSGARLFDVASGAVRSGPQSRVVLASRHALIWRTAADLAANPQVYRITPE